MTPPATSNLLEVPGLGEEFHLEIVLLDPPDDDRVVGIASDTPEACEAPSIDDIGAGFACDTSDQTTLAVITNLERRPGAAGNGDRGW